MRKFLTISLITLALVACTAVIAHAPIVHAAAPASTAGTPNPTSFSLPTAILLSMLSC